MNGHFPPTLKSALQTTRRWLVTGAAGFIGSHLVAGLLENGQRVVGLDDFSTGRSSNLDAIRSRVGAEAWGRFHLLQGSIEDRGLCLEACRGIERILHHAALVSVPLSLEAPDRCTHINIGGFANILEAGRRNGVRRVVYASSSAVYGDASGAANREDLLGAPLSPYALSKRVNELQAGFYSQAYGLETVGLRYFNVFGPRQDPKGAYAAVVPRWVEAVRMGQACRIFGDGTATRDFCYVADVVQANLLAALMEGDGIVGQLFNIGRGDATSLLDLHRILTEESVKQSPGTKPVPPVREDPRPGDIQHSSAEVSRARCLLGFQPAFDLAEGLRSVLAEEA